MKYELKTFFWHCDCCENTRHVTAKSLYDSRPDGWITVEIPASFDGIGMTHDYCQLCVMDAQNKHNITENNHFGLILRHFAYLKESPKNE